MTANRITIDAAEHSALLARAGDAEERAARAESESAMVRALVAALGDHHDGGDVIASVRALVAHADRLEARWDAAHDALWAEHRRGGDIAEMARAMQTELRDALAYLDRERARADRLGAIGTEAVQALSAESARTREARFGLRVLRAALGSQSEQTRLDGIAAADALIASWGTAAVVVEEDDGEI